MSATRPLHLKRRGKPRPSFGIRALKVAFYVGHIAAIERVPLLDAQAKYPGEITVDLSAGTWTFKRGKSQEGPFKIGVGLRVPQGKEFWGPMLVYCTHIGKHMAVLARAEDELAHGELSSS